MHLNVKSHYINWIETVEKAEKDPQLAQALVEKAKRDKFYFFNQWLWTYDPRKEIKTLPFLLYGFQEEYINDLDWSYNHKKPILVEKTRDMGFSWVTLGYFTHKMVFEPGFSAGVGSAKFDKVDKLGDMDSLMEKVRFMLRRLPSFFNSGYEEKNSKIGQIVLLNNSSMSGEGGDNIGRGGRKSMYLLDEFAHVPRSTLVQKAVSQTSTCRIYGSTPNGKGNEFARLKHKTKIRVCTLHWAKHPEKDDAWYNEQKETMTEEMIAQELDISYSKSAAGRVHKWFDQKTHAPERLDFNPNSDLYITIDFGIGDPTSVIFLQYIGHQVRIFDHFEVKDNTIPKIFNEIGRRLSNLERSGSPLGFKDVAGYYGDPDARNRERISGDTIANYVWDNYGARLKFKLPNLIRPRLQAVQYLGENNRIAINSELHFFIECVENYRYPEKEHGENEKPIHDWTSHSMSALEYYCVVEHPMTREEKNEGVITSQRFR